MKRFNSLIMDTAQGAMEDIRIHQSFERYRSLNWSFNKIFSSIQRYITVNVIQTYFYCALEIWMHRLGASRMWIKMCSARIKNSCIDKVNTGMMVYLFRLFFLTVLRWRDESIHIFIRNVPSTAGTLKSFRFLPIPAASRCRCKRLQASRDDDTFMYISDAVCSPSTFALRVSS